MLVQRGMKLTFARLNVNILMSCYFKNVKLRPLQDIRNRLFDTSYLLSTSLISLFQTYDGDGSKIKNDKLSPFSEKQERNVSVPWPRVNIESLNLSWKTNKGKSSNQNSKSEKFKLEWLQSPIRKRKIFQ